MVLWLCISEILFLLASLIGSRAKSLFVFTWGINQLLQEKYSFLGAWKKRRYWTDFHSTLTKNCCLPEKYSTGAWCKQNKWYFEKFCMQKHSRSSSIGGLLRIHVSRVVRGLGGVRGSSTSCKSKTQEKNRFVKCTFWTLHTKWQFLFWVHS